MCKRSVASFHSNKRPKRETLYTQGPLDEKFGQHAAFPLDSASARECNDSSVFDYLAEVRKEAESDASVHFISRNIERKTHSNTPKTTQLSPQYVKMVIDRLEQEKLANKRQVVQKMPLDWCEIDEDAGEYHVDSKDDGDVRVNVNVEVEEPDDQKPAMEVPQSASAWRNVVFSQSPPPISFFNVTLEHATIIKLIVYYTKWLLVSMPSTLTEWIFITFVRLDNGLDHTEMSLVRDLGRKARKLRTKFLEGKNEGLSIPAVAEETVDMILAVVGVYYGQRDLLVDEEE